MQFILFLWKSVLITVGLILYLINSTKPTYYLFLFSYPKIALAVTVSRARAGTPCPLAIFDRKQNFSSRIERVNQQ